jgi:hypothetical protein
VRLVFDSHEAESARRHLPMVGCQQGRSRGVLLRAGRSLVAQEAMPGGVQLSGVRSDTAV